MMANDFPNGARSMPQEVFGHAAYAERRLPDGVLATFELTPLPEDAVVTQVTLVPFRGERPVLAWKDGRLWLPEGETGPGESADQTIRRVALEQVGIAGLSYEKLGHLRCRATSESKHQAEGTITYRPLYAVDVQELGDFPTNQAYERRISTQRDLNDLIRSHYLELRREYMEVIDLVVLARRKAAASGS